MPESYTVAQYVHDLRAIRNTGSALPETSFYPPVDRLLNEAGRTLKPPVLATSQLADTGAGQPDGGLFPQPKRSPRNPHPPLPVHPERGVVEIKPANHDLDTIAVSEQTLRYLRHYGLVLITNLRQFRLLEHNPGGSPHVREKYTLAESADDLWYAPIPQLATRHNDLLPDFLRRVMLSKVPLADPKDVAWLLASYAREARARAEEHDLPFFRNVKLALEESLGIAFEGEKGDHFFRSTLVQTLFYGIFSAWVLWRRSSAATHHAPSHPLVPFNWRLADDFLHVPILRKLFREISDRRTLDSIQIAEILDLAGNVLNRVQPALFDVFRVEEAVAYFYEPFLEAFDPQLRKELGVWYTPREIVGYMVERVDHLLRSELAQPLGLASPNVRILDPCCGTGAYLTAVLHRIHRTLTEQAGDDPWQVPDQLRTAALNRIFGFEIMPAPFVIAHMEINRLLEEAGAPLPDHQRAGVFLTNALTGWIPSQHPKSIFAEMDQEREAAEDIKQHGTILVILGNPPYNGYAGIATIKEERHLTTAYRSPVAGLPAPQGQGLNDLYIRFFRIAERRIAQNPDGQGIVCFISNNAWLDGLSHTSMRSHFLHAFGQIYIDNLNGDKYRTGKTTPEGKPDPSAFSTASNREGIQVGTAIATLVRNRSRAAASGAPSSPTASSSERVGYRAVSSTALPTDPQHHLLHPASTPVHLRDLWGTGKLSHLERESHRELDPTYTSLTPNPALGLPFAHRTVSTAYTTWPRLPELFPVFFPGIKTSRDQLLVDIDRDRLEARMKHYFDPRVSDEIMSRESPCSLDSTARFRASEVRETLQLKGYRPWQILKYTYRPFDTRWLYWEPTSKLLDEKREDYVFDMIGVTNWLEARQRESLPPFSRGATMKAIADNFGNGLSTFFPAVTLAVANYNWLDGNGDKFRGLGPFYFRTANLSEAALKYLYRFGIDASPEASPRLKPEEATDLFFHALAIMHTPLYRTENAGALLGDWPRIPLPSTADLLTHSATLGRRLANLLDPESTADLSRNLFFLAALKLPQRPGNNTLHTDDLQLTAGWGARGQGSTVMPGRGRLSERPWTPAELAKLETLAATEALTPTQAQALLGETCVDVYLNHPTGDVPSIFWSAVPIHVWNYTLGGYQVLKKWLSYRELPLLGRPLKPEEAAWFSEVVRRITSILLLGPALDRSYAAILPTSTGLPS